MKIKVISRNPNTYQRETTDQRNKIVRNFNTPADPFRAQVEYTRALNATKLERVFAKPFVASLDGHVDGVQVLAKHPNRPSQIYSGARDGTVKVWNLASRECQATIEAHRGLVNDISVDNNTGDNFVTVGQDSHLKYWKISSVVDGQQKVPAHSTPLDGIIYGVSHLSFSSDFVTCGEDISVWKPFRETPLRSYNLGTDTIHTCRANPVEENVIVGARSDRSIFVLDTRQDVPVKKVTMKMRPNKISWNPMEAYSFTVASEDFSLYTFDMRYMEHPTQSHQGFTSAVLDVDYSPTGQEFVAAGYDRSIRLFKARDMTSRDVYYTKRMASVLSVLWSADAKFVLSGSNEMNIRVWKANAAEKLGPLTKREKQAFAYNEKLRDTYKNHPEVRRIAKHRNVPRHIFTAAKEHKLIKDARARRDLRRAKAAGLDEEDSYLPQTQKVMVGDAEM
ncbi:hypothetical protein CAEBREN_05371 [Caenorhabditis brenneri]|uniref:DDB1- and CUL4-associated factor 13 n=1 Tax=Caenorhabditis brenneri TaxID=135651 RepID=G0MN98_CAEBE|nr:hypothetical protein CAEBREN_13313 [Caenorhabditis brenneri]EGT60529.1 hypothetical protein CAEBREN_05371 [Caenorhabditis brenneri]